MKNNTTFIIILLSIFCVFFRAELSAAIPASERAALIALYNSTDGDYWKNNSGWKTPPLHSDGFAMPGTEEDWFGVGTSGYYVSSLYLNYNGLSGPLPSELKDLTSISSIFITGNNLAGPIPAEIGGLTKLTSLRLSNNKLTGAIPPSLGNLTRLTLLNLHINQLTGSIPVELSNLSELYWMDLSSNQLSGEIPPELGRLIKLEKLSFYHNQLTGTVPIEFLQLTRLQNLLVNVNQLSGPVPVYLSEMTSLETLALGGNQYTGTIPPEYGNLSNLLYLGLNENKLTGSIPKELGNLSVLTGLDLYKNQLTGSIPKELGNLPELNYLELNHNQLSGAIPPELGNDTKLIYLDISHNKLSGSLPPELGNLRTLIYCMMHFNELTGSIPSTFKNLTALRYLQLEHNHLSGPIPTFFANYTNLKLLHLEQNKFTGGIPAELCTLQYLDSFRVRNNALTWEIPDAILNLPLKKALNNWHYSRFQYNGLYTHNEEVRAFLESVNPGWEETQTVTPENVTATAVSSSSIKVSCEANLYRSGLGGYNVYYSETPGGPWTHAGLTANKSTTYYVVSGLKAGTTYYFVMDAESFNNDYVNINHIISNKSEQASATTPLIAGTQGLTVQSSPVAGVPITVTPNDYYGNGGGNAPFSRIYNDGTAVTLTAPATHNGYNFSKWVVDGTDTPSAVIQVTMNTGHTVTAVYEEPAPPPTPTYTLTVQSQPVNGVSITVTPADNNSLTNGSTAFSRIYDERTAVTLTAPAESGGKAFVKWTLDGVDKTGNTVTVTMNGNHIAVAVYEDDTAEEPKTLQIESTHSSGTPITISPVDLNGDGSGTTKFSRSYNKGTSVTLTAPAEHNGHKFDRWTLDGKKITSGVTMTFTISGDHKAKAFYVTPAHPGLVVRPVKLNFGVIQGEIPASQIMRVTINNSPVDWSAAAADSWLSLGAVSGYGSAEVPVSVNIEGLAPGKYKSSITVTAPDAEHSPQTVDVNLTVYKSGQTAEPKGDFATPLDGSTVSGSIAVTGWVVDDIGVESVKIYREGNHKNDLIYIGDAVFVEDARPDVEALFPEYPESNKAGWGYMLLTNFLPDGGNGTFKLHVVALDGEGYSVDLGVKTIICDNANAVKPFGAIDTPTQGGEASGDKFVNWGWVLTPQPAAIPTDGSTITVWVDGVNIGNPTYNIYRADIAGLFPGYANTNGAVGYFYLDTSAYEDGLHTIQWLATDDMGNTDGIGSRYFIVNNAGQGRTSGQSSLPLSAMDIAVDNRQPVRVQKGFDSNNESIFTYPGADGEITIEINELDRVELHLGNPGDMITAEPIGSTFDRYNGVFYWQPGAGFLGDYGFEFILRRPDGQKIRKRIQITVQAVKGNR